MTEPKIVNVYVEVNAFNSLQLKTDVLNFRQPRQPFA